MDRVISFLLFGLLFYLMMRFGCGSHAVHGHHHHGEDRGTVNAEKKDPVCGMTVAPGQGYSEVYDGREYRFCSRICLDKFDKSPEQFARA